MATLSWRESSEGGEYAPVVSFEPMTKKGPFSASVYDSNNSRLSYVPEDDGQRGSVVSYQQPYAEDNYDDGTVIAYEPVRTLAAQRRRNNNNRLRICKAKLTLSFSVYIVTGGTLLTMGTFLLSGILFVIGFLALGFSAFIAAAWLFFNKAFSLVSAASNRLTPKPLMNSPREHSLQHVD